MSLRAWFRCLVVLIAAVAGNPAFAETLQLDTTNRWLVLGARQKEAEAVDLARDYGLRLTPVKVVRGANGWFAVITGPLAVTTLKDATALIEPLIYLPTDAYLSRGERYRDVVFTAPPSPILAFKAYDGGKPATVMRDNLSVTIDSVPAEDKMRAPSFKGTLAGAAAFSDVMKDSTDDKPNGQVRIICLDPKTKEPQVVMSSFSNGAHCCTTTRIATQIPSGEWRVIEAKTLDGDGYSFEDAAGNGVVDLVSVDNAFLYAFSSYADSFAPTRIERLADGALKDVTSEPALRPYLLRGIANWEKSAAENPSLWKSNGFLAGWVAAKAQVGAVDEAWTRMLANYDRNSDFPTEVCETNVDLSQCPKDKIKTIPFPDALRKHLVSLGYPVPASAPKK